MVTGSAAVIDDSITIAFTRTCDSYRTKMDECGLGRDFIMEPHITTCSKKVYLFIDRVEEGDREGFKAWLRLQLEDNSLGTFGTFGDLA